MEPWYSCCHPPTKQSLAVGGCLPSCLQTSNTNEEGRQKRDTDGGTDNGSERDAGTLKRERERENRKDRQTRRKNTQSERTNDVDGGRPARHRTVTSLGAQSSHGRCPNESRRQRCDPHFSRHMHAELDSQTPSAVKTWSLLDAKLDMSNTLNETAPTCIQATTPNAVSQALSSTITPGVRCTSYVDAGMLRTSRDRETSRHGKRVLRKADTVCNTTNGGTKPRRRARRPQKERQASNHNGGRGPCRRVQRRRRCLP